MGIGGQNGRTALFAAAAEGREEAIKLLLERKADVNKADTVPAIPRVCIVSTQKKPMVLRP